MKFPYVALCVIALWSEASSTRSAASHDDTLKRSHIQFSQEWHLWKGQHRKEYSSLREELGKHLVWLSNQEYINQHNKYSDVFGYSLKMNQFGDMVSYSTQMHEDNSGTCTLLASAW